MGAISSRQRAIDIPAEPSSARPLVRWAVDVGPLVWVTAWVWGKLVYVSVLLPGISWAADESPPILGAILAYPEVPGATLASLALLFAALPVVQRTARYVILLGLDAVLTTIAVADLMHVRFYADVSSVSELSSTYMLPWVLESVSTLLRPADLVHFLDVLVGLMALPFYLRACRQVPALGRRRAASLSIGLLASGLILIVPAARLVSLDGGGVLAYNTVRLEAASAIGILPYHVAEAATTWASGQRATGDAERQRVRHFLSELRRQQASRSSLFGVAAGRNVILMSAESIQAFPIGLEVAGQQVAPRLTAFAAESLHFVNFFEQTHMGSTADAEFAIMQSLHPLSVGVVAARYWGNHHRALPETLARQGYHTFSAVAALGHFWNMERLHPRYGFQDSFFEESYRVTDRVAAWMADRDFFAQTVPILESRAEPFMGFLLSSSSHHPYQIPEGDRVLQLGALEGTMVGDYLHAVSYFDRAFGQLVDRLRESGLLDRSVFVLYGDHQAFLGNQPELPELLGLASWGEYERFDVVKRVPLLIRLPHGQAAGRRTAAGGQIDAAPTLLSLLGVVDEGSVGLGRDLTGAGESLVVFRDGSFADGTHYFINRFGPTSASRCYEAASGRQLDCRLLEAKRARARERLEMSDLIVQGDLIPALAAGP